MMRSSVLTMTLALFSVAYAPVLLADDAQEKAPADQSSPSDQQSTPSYSEQELRSFSVAMLEVERIKSSYAPKLAQNLREQAQIKQAASLELLLALKQQGMSVDKYQEMLANVQQDPEMAGKVNENLKKSAKERGIDENGDSAKDEDSALARPKSNASAKSVQKVEEL